MNLYWLYELPIWQLFILIIGLLLSFSLFGASKMRKRFDRIMELDSDTNNVVGYFLSFTGAFYGIMLGLVAVGAWETYNSASDAAEREAAAVASLYRDVSYLPAPHDGKAQAYLRAYAWDVINLEWPEQQQGNTPYSARRVLEKLVATVNVVEPATPREEVALNLSAAQLNSLLEIRRFRVEASEDGLPGSLWVVIAGGAIINIMMTWMLTIKSAKLDFAINASMAVLLGGVLSFIIAMDNPFRGELSVQPSSMQNIYAVIMDGSGGRPRVG
jgi:hypothetical protein